MRRDSRPATVAAVLAAVAISLLAVLPDLPGGAASARPTETARANAPAAYGLWSDSVVPDVPKRRDTRSATLGLVFSSSKDGVLNGIQYYAAGPNKAATVGHLWGSGGKKLATVRFPTAQRRGWKTARFSTPVSIRAGVKYTASYRAPAGRYAIAKGVFSDDHHKKVRSLTAYRGTYGRDAGRPTRSWHGSHYFVDVVFVPSAATPTPTPPSTGYPDESNTGVPAGTVLSAYTGPSTISTAGTVIDGKTLGCIRVEAPGVVIRNSRISCAGIAVAAYDGDFEGTRLLLEDVEIDCKNAPGSAGIGDALVTVRRAEITACENGLDINEEVTVEDSYIHGLYNGGDAHMDGIQLAYGHIVNGQVEKGALNVVIRHNTIYGMDPGGEFGTSAIITNPSGDRNILIEDNLLAGGAATVYCNRPGSGTNFRLTNNRFSTRFSSKVGFYFPAEDCGAEIVSGNVYHETGKPVPLGG